VHINGLSSITTADTIEIQDNTNLLSLEGLTNLTMTSSVSINNNKAQCGTFNTNLIAAGLDYAILQLECCGNGVQEGTEACETSDANCSKKCTLCTTSTANDCNCAAKPCTTKPWGLCLYNGSCSYDPNAVLKPLCGRPLPGYSNTTNSSTTPTTNQTTTTSSTGTQTSTTGTTTVGPVDDKNCTIEDGVLTCNVITTELDLMSVSELNVYSNLTVNGVNIKVGPLTRLHISGCLYIKNNSKLTISKTAFKNHRKNTFMDYQCIYGKFTDVIYNEDTQCRQHTVTYDNGQLTVNYVDPCEDKTGVSSSITGIFVIIGGAIAIGGALFYFVKNRKRQEKKSQGLGVR